MVTNLHNYSHIKGTSGSAAAAGISNITGANKWRRLKGIDHRLDRIEEVKMKMDWKMEEPVLVAKIRESSVRSLVLLPRSLVTTLTGLHRLRSHQVLLSKDSSKWNWDIVGELIDGPLRYPAHLATACKTKFFKRILYFLRPNSYLFSVFPYSDVRRRLAQECERARERERESISTHSLSIASAHSNT